MSAIALWLGVGVLGGIGGVARFLVNAIVSSRSRAQLPLGTLLVNVSGAVLLGIVARIAVTADGYLLAGTALVGSYTTFSTWMLESQRLDSEHGRWMLGANIALNLALGLGAVAVGQLIGAG